MSGVFRSGGSAPESPRAGGTVQRIPAAEAAPSPATGGDAMGGTGGMAEARSPVTRASTMLSPRRREDEMRPTVGTKKLLGQ